MNAVILVAGRERKLLPYTKDMHQCLFRLSDNKTLLEDMLEKVISLGQINKIVITVGHKKELISKELRSIKKRLGFKDIICIENKDFLKTNVIYSLWLARKYLTEPFLLIDGDVICERELLRKIIHHRDKNDNLLLVDFDYKLKERDNKVKIIGNRIVRIGKDVPLTNEAKFGRSIGICKISAGNDVLIKRMNELIHQNKRNLIYEDVFDEILHSHLFRPVPTYGFNWMEVDNIDEFKRMNSIFSALEKLKDEAVSLGATHVFPIDPKEIVFDDKVLLFCFKCAKYDKKCTCPPRIPKIDYRQMLLGYKKGIIVALKSKISTDWQRIRTDSTKRLHHILLDLEKFAFQNSYHFANSFIGGSCKLCPDCPEVCRMPNLSRIPLEAIGVDVLKTVGKVGLRLKFPVKGHFYRVGLLMVG